jgi:hypothetical protein
LHKFATIFGYRIYILKFNEAQVNAITNAKVEEVYFLARNTFKPSWSNQNYGSSFEKTYHSPAGVTNNDNYKGNNGNHQSVEGSLKTFMQVQTEQNNLVIKMTEKHETALEQLCKKLSLGKLIYMIC